MDKALVFVHGSIKTPPMSAYARQATGALLRLLQRGAVLSMPQSRPMPVLGPRCHELRIPDPEASQTWRILYRTDATFVLVLDVFSKKTQKTPKGIIDNCKKRLREVDAKERR